MPHNNLKPADGVLGSLDTPTGEVITDRFVDIKGWAMSAERLPSRVLIRVNGQLVGKARLGLPRPDVAQSMTPPHSIISGYQHRLDLAGHRKGPCHIAVAGVIGGVERTLGEQTVWLDPVDAPSQVRPGARHGRSTADRDGSVTGSGRGQAPFRLAVVSHTLGIAGAEMWLTDFLRLTKAGDSYPCHLLSYEDGPLAGTFREQGVEVEVSSGSQPEDQGELQARTQEIEAWLIATNCTAVLVNTVIPWESVRAAARAQVPCGWVVHESWQPAELWGEVFASASAAIRREFEVALRQASAVLFVSGSTRDVYQDHVELAKTMVLPPGVDRQRVDMDGCQERRASARARLGIRSDSRLILSLGVSQPRKQQTLLVEAFSELIDAYPDAVLAVVGGVPSEYWDALGVYVQRRGLSGRVRLEDRTPDVTDWYEAADAFICTSDVESMPRTVMEAMCFALPVAATDIYGSGELLDHGVTGLLLRAHDRDEIVRALVQLLQPDPTELKRIGRAGYDFARRSLSADRWAGQVDALLRAMSSQPDADPATLLSEVTSRATPNAR